MRAVKEKRPHTNSGVGVKRVTAANATSIIRSRHRRVNDYKVIAERCLEKFRVIEGEDNSYYAARRGSPYVMNLENDEFADEVKTSFGLTDVTFKNLLPYLRSKAESVKVFSRVGKDEEGNLFIDLGNHVVKVSFEGWDITKDCPILFRKSKPLPKRVKAPAQKLVGFLANLFPQLDEDQAKLVAGFMIGCFVPHGTKPILVITGGAGSGKTSLSKGIKQLLDPSEVLTQALPKRFDESYALIAETQFLLVFDNVSEISEEMSDTLCRTASGSGLSSRKFYSQKSVVDHKFHNPIILNGLGSIVLRGDLRSRCICVDIERIHERKPEKSLEEMLRKVRPKILGAVFDALQRALANFDSVKLRYDHRLIDFVQWVVASQAIEEFEEVFYRSTLFESLTAIKENPSLQALLEGVRKKGEVEGEAQEVVKELNLPLLPNQLRSFLQRNAEALKNVGIRFEVPSKRTGKSRGLYRIWCDGCDDLDLSLS